MPEPLHPPYSPNSTQVPKLLNRWLDVNSQNGPLTRTRKYITLPAFTLTANWRGYSEIIGEFLFASTNSLSLLIDPTALPLYPFYTLCVSCIRGGKVYRYRLFSNDTEVFYFTIPKYNGERLEKNFKLEVWSVPTMTIKQTTPITFYTSVLGDKDYRYGTDEILALDAGLCQGQQTVSDGSGSLPLPFIFGVCTYNYGSKSAVVLLSNQIQQVITNENNTPISIN